MRRGLGVLVMAALVACGGGGGDDAAKQEPTTTAAPTTAAVPTSTEAPTTTVAPTTTIPPTTATPVLRYPSGDPVLPGYPLIVPVSTIDRRPAAWMEDNLVDGQVVALAPGLYRAYNPAVPDLTAYLDGPVDGDCLLKDQFFPSAGGACWDGVQRGSAEPAG
jgi:hypothetical protein